MTWGDEVLESRPFGLWSLDAYLAQTFEQKTAAYSCVVSLVHACLAQLHQDLEPGQGAGARKSWKAGLLDFGPWMHILGTLQFDPPPETCQNEAGHWKLLMKALSKNVAEKVWDDEEFCKAYEALEEHDEQYQSWMRRDSVFRLQVKKERQEDEELFEKVEEQEREDT